MAYQEDIQQLDSAMELVAMPLQTSQWPNRSIMDINYSR
jgi:hypothetical protein